MIKGLALETSLWVVFLAVEIVELEFGGAFKKLVCIYEELPQSHGARNI